MWKDRIDMMGIWMWLKDINWLCLLGIHNYEIVNMRINFIDLYKKCFPEEAKYFGETEQWGYLTHLECKRCHKCRKNRYGNKLMNVRTVENVTTIIK